MWNITGNLNQQRIIRESFDRIKFPFYRLKLPGTPELGWRDLNTGHYSAEKVRAHGDNLHDGDKPDTLEGEVEGRRFIMGVIYPMSGRIFLDVRLEKYPEVAAATLGAEIAHAVDYFLPMTDDMRNELLRLWNKPGTTWWEVRDYGAEYYTLGGEAFMHEFVQAYSDIPFGDKSSFSHDAGVEPADVRRILGIERTDYVPPAPPPPPPPPKVEVAVYGRSKIYHKPDRSVHPTYTTSPRLVTSTTGLRPCKVCKP